MKASMDGLRRNLASAYRLALFGYRSVKEPPSALTEGLEELRSMIAGSMCIYSEDPEDLFSDMANEVDKLLPLVEKKKVPV